MKHIVSAGSVILAMMATGCGEQFDEMKQAMQNVESIANSPEQAQQSMDKVQQRIQERRAARDTIPIAYEELQKRLRDINGWTGEAPTGESVAIPGLAVATASRAHED